MTAVVFVPVDLFDVLAVVVVVIVLIDVLEINVLLVGLSVVYRDVVVVVGLCVMVVDDDTIVVDGTDELVGGVELLVVDFMVDAINVAIIEIISTNLWNNN